MTVDSSSNSPADFNGDGESTARRAAKDFDLLSPLNGYPDVFSIFEGETLVLRVARKSGLPLPRLFIQLLWANRLTARLRYRALGSKARRPAQMTPPPAAFAIRIDIRDCVSGSLLRSQPLGDPVPIFEELPASYKDNGAAYTARISVDTAGWPVGVYECVIHDDRRGVSQDIYVNIKPRTLLGADLLCILPSFTWQAYNRVGGGSFYSPELGHIRTICTQRPMHHRGDNSIVPALAILSLFRSHGVRIACVDSWDLHNGLLPAGDVPVAAILVHDEYWSGPMRAQFDRLLDRGTSILVVSGNTCWWHIDADGRNLSVRKEPSKRELWHLIDRPEEQTLVSSFRFAGYAVERARRKPRLAGHVARLSRTEIRDAGAITVTDATHPLFAGVALGEDGSFGHDVPVVYRELDGVPLNKEGRVAKGAYKANGIEPGVIATGLALSGKNLRKVGLVVDARVGGGYVLHMGSIGWSRGVTQKNAGVQRIVMNAYARCRAMATKLLPPP